MDSYKRDARHEAHAEGTYRAFLHEIVRIAGISPELAEAGAVSVLYRLGQRIAPQETHDLEAQLPSRLREKLKARRTPSGAQVHRFGLAQFLHMVADDLRRSDHEAKRIVSAVFQIVRNKISQGEADDVAAGLPEDLALLWRYPAGSYVPEQTKDLAADFDGERSVGAGSHLTWVDLD